MTIYILVFSYLLFCSIICPYIKKKNNSYILYLLGILFLILVSGLRFNVGMDYPSYYLGFKGQSDFNESGFNFLRDFFLLVFSSNSPYYFFFFISLITLLSASRFICNYSKIPILSLFIFFCFGQYFLATLNLIRQEIVIYIFWGFLVRFILKKEVIAYMAIICVLSCLFHNTALFLIILYFFTRKISLKFKLIFFIAFILSQTIIIGLIENSSYAIYLKMTDFTAKITILQCFVFCLALYFFYYFEKKQVRNRNKFEIFIENINYLNVLFGCSMLMFNDTPIMQVCSRLSYYTVPLYILLIPNYISNIHNDYNRTIGYYLTISTYSVIFLFALFFNGKDQHYVPYHSIFDNLI